MKEVQQVKRVEASLVVEALGTWGHPAEQLYFRSYKYEERVDKGKGPVEHWSVLDNLLWKVSGA